MTKIPAFYWDCFMFSKYSVDVVFYRYNPFIWTRYRWLHEQCWTRYCWKRRWINSIVRSSETVNFYCSGKKICRIQFASFFAFIHHLPHFTTLNPCCSVWGKKRMKMEEHIGRYFILFEILLRWFLCKNCKHKKDLRTLHFPTTFYSNYYITNRLKITFEKALGSDCIKFTKCYFMRFVLILSVVLYRKNQTNLC